MTLGAGFRICGIVERKFVAASGKFASITLAYPGRKGTAKTECRAFDADIIARIAAVGQGETVQVTGGFDNEKLTDKAKQEIQVDGRAAYTTKLTIRALTVEGEDQKDAASKPEDSISAPPAPASDLDDPRDNDWR